MHKWKLDHLTRLVLVMTPCGSAAQRTTRLLFMVNHSGYVAYILLSTHTHIVLCTPVMTHLSLYFGIRPTELMALTQTHTRACKHHHTFDTCEHISTHRHMYTFTYPLFSTFVH